MTNVHVYCRVNTDTTLLGHCVTPITVENIQGLDEHTTCIVSIVQNTPDSINGPLVN